MATKIINVLCHFLAFAKAFFYKIIHNMLTLMFYLCFINMDCIMDHIEKYEEIILVWQYGDLVLLTLLIFVLAFKNPSQATTLAFATPKLFSIQLFGLMAS
jgi:hypothetical protein